MRFDSHREISDMINPMSTIPAGVVDKNEFMKTHTFSKVNGVYKWIPKTVNDSLLNQLQEKKRLSYATNLDDAHRIAKFQ